MIKQQEKIHIFRQKLVMIDRDVALFLGTSTKNLNKVLRRNKNNFSKNFAFDLSEEETLFLNSFYRYQIGSFKKHRKSIYKHPPIVFTQSGIIMAANLVYTPEARKFLQIS